MGGDGVQVRGCGATRTVIARTCTQRSGEMVIIGRDGREFRLRGERGVRPRGSGAGQPPHYGWDTTRKVLENRTPNPIRHHP